MRRSRTSRAVTRPPTISRTDGSTLRVTSASLARAATSRTRSLVAEGMASSTSSTARCPDERRDIVAAAQHDESCRIRDPASRIVVDQPDRRRTDRGRAGCRVRTSRPPHPLPPGAPSLPASSVPLASRDGTRRVGSGSGPHQVRAQRTRAEHHHERGTGRGAGSAIQRHDQGGGHRPERERASGPLACSRTATSGRRGRSPRSRRVERR